MKFIVSASIMLTGTFEVEVPDDPDELPTIHVRQEKAFPFSSAHPIFGGAVTEEQERHLRSIQKVGFLRLVTGAQVQFETLLKDEGVEATSHSQEDLDKKVAN